MARLPLAWMIVIGFALWGGRALADPAAAPPRTLRLAFADSEMPAPKETTGPGLPGGPEKPAEPIGSLQEEGSIAPPDLAYGVAMRARWVTVPAFMLNLFTRRNVPLSSYALAIEGYRRKGNFDFMVAIGYQNMSPSDGNWLGKDQFQHPANVDTDYVQFKGLALVTLDASFIWRNWFSKSFGIHYGAGLGVGIKTGQMLRTSDAGCTETNAGDVTQCHPLNVDCSSGVCNEQQLANTSRAGGERVDSAATPSRFVDQNIPAAVPIVNIVLGIDFRLPQVPNLEAKIEGGFYDAFFLGGGIVYRIF
jgi:hypothetical protein